MADLGTGITITYDTAFFGTITSMSFSGITRQAVDVTTFATTGGKAYIESQLYDLGTLDIEMLLAPGTAPSIVAGGSETCTVTWSDSGTATWAATAFMTNFAPGASDSEARTTASASLQFTGAVTITP
jgi:hypothetical protein